MSGNKYIVVLFFVFSTVISFGQDTIIFRNGEIKIAQVEEVGVNLVKYRKFNYLDGPIFISSKNEILKIKYKGGNVDTFQITAHVAGLQVPVAVTNTLSLTRGIRFTCRGLYINNDELDQLIARYPNASVKQKLDAKSQEIKEYVKRSRIAPSIGLPVGFVLPFVTTISGLEIVSTANYDSGITIIIGGIVVGAAIRITAAVIQKVNKNKARNAREELVEMYNANLQ
jgi:hypothetical protein